MTKPSDETQPSRPPSLSLVLTALGRLWLPILVWVVLLVVLVIGLRVAQVSSVLQGGVLGAFCGATLVVIFSVRERAAAGRRAPVHQRYR
jgi:hypothetical protein